MSTRFVQDVLKTNPNLSINHDLTNQDKFIEQLIDEIHKREYEPFDSEAQRQLFEQLRKVAGVEVAMTVDEAIGTIKSDYSRAAFAMGYYVATNPHWFVFEQPTE